MKNTLFASLVTTTFIWANIIYSNENIFQDKFHENYSLICEDPYKCFLSLGINLEDDIITLPKNQKFKKNHVGISNGSIYHNGDQIIYIKHSNPFIELMASRLMNLFIGTTYSPIVKVIRDESEKYTIASLKLPGFQPISSFNKSDKIIKGKANLAVAQALLGVVDQNKHNMGVVRVNSKTYYAARVDLDSSFDYTSKLQGTYSLDTDYLDLKHLHLAIQTFPKQEVINAIKQITDVSDEKIIMTIFQAWATLCQAGYLLSLDPCLTLAHQIIDRKNAFREAIENKNSNAYKLIAKKHKKKKYSKQLTK